ncbi:glycosyltransferase family 2 protein [Agreia sp. COWG]|uniref:glycosyltransferase family 2 protein n=1 Tax=Agreia sp. COWG TaxID=2773266 RepID=UPI001928118D|nr:glycosyltransferase family 2 protein [Agreia sp. COWG]CAD5991202.1 Glycosyltransferase involved in cell wall bisynthesis [Agreia sp. COWG]
MPTLSLCICTMNRPEELTTALQSILDGSSIPEQIIVSDDGDGSAREVAQSFAGVTYLPGPRRGLGANRNNCIAAATGDLIAFIDDDVTVDSEFVAVAKQSSVAEIITTGWELNHSHDPARKVSAHNASFLGFQRVAPGNHLEAICINATVFPRGLFENALFDEQIRYGYEEIDIARHAVSLGWSIVYNDDLHVKHFPAASNRDGYAGVLNVSRLYITHKAYRHYERNRAKAAAFNVVAAVHHLAYAVKGGHRFGEAVMTIRAARKKQRAHR